MNTIQIDGKRVRERTNFVKGSKKSLGWEKDRKERGGKVERIKGSFLHTQKVSFFHSCFMQTKNREGKE